MMRLRIIAIRMMNKFLPYLLALAFFVTFPMTLAVTSWWVSFVFGYDVGFWAALFVCIMTVTVAALGYEFMSMKEEVKKQ